MSSAAASVKAPATPDAADEAVKAARLQERRRQLGFQGRMSTFLTDYQGQRGAGISAPQDGKTLLGQ
jgi:hypothetical protein